MAEEHCTHKWPNRTCDDCLAYGRIEPKQPGPLHHEIVTAQHELDALRREYLLRWGWVQTCHTPGSFWLWVRDFSDYDKKFDPWREANPDRPREPYGVFTAPTELAISMTVACLDEQQELGDCDD